jgi:hypothetical protein
VAPIYGQGATLVFKYSKGFKEIAEKGLLALVGLQV